MFELKENNMDSKETESSVLKGLNKITSVLLFTLGVLMIVNGILKVVSLFLRDEEDDEE